MNLFQVYIWFICFVSVYVALFWINVIAVEESYMKVSKIKKKVVGNPLVSIAVPMYNEENGILNTLNSLIEQDYKNLEIIVIDDASKDNSVKIVKEFMKKHKNVKLLVHSKNSGSKAFGVNDALKIAKGEYFAVMDADCTASSHSLSVMLAEFDVDNIGGVIAPVMALEPKTMVEKMQSFEYVAAAFFRNLMSNIGTLHNSNGVLSLFRTELIRKLGGFDEQSITEDFEIAMRLRYNHYNVVLCKHTKNYTHVPATFPRLWRQRVRWYRGFISTMYKYRKMTFNKGYGLLGLFQVPLNLFTLVLVFVSLILMTSQFFTWCYRIFQRLYVLKWEVFDIFYMPSIKEYILGLDVSFYFPVVLSFVAGLYLYYKAYKYINEKWRFHFASILYLFVYPMFRSLQWLQAFFMEVFKVQRKW